MSINPILNKKILLKLTFIKTNENMNISANSITNNAGVLLSKGKATLISNDDFVNKNGGSIK
ncbi:hypothetical protein CJ667_09280, partial [Aliarcobacter cryaerophilus]